jgi:hypothetical protein
VLASAWVWLLLLLSPWLLAWATVKKMGTDWVLAKERRRATGVGR